MKQQNIQRERRRKEEVKEKVRIKLIFEEINNIFY